MLLSSVIALVAVGLMGATADAVFEPSGRIKITDLNYNTTNNTFTINWEANTFSDKNISNVKIKFTDDYYAMDNQSSIVDKVFPKGVSTASGVTTVTSIHGEPLRDDGWYWVQAVLKIQGGGEIVKTFGNFHFQLNEYD